MKRVLIITYYYPPSPAIAARRPFGLAKYLPQFGWEPVVITPRFNGGERGPEVIETEDRELIAAWKARLGLDPGRGLHQQLNLPVGSSLKRRLPHTALLSWARELLTFPDAQKGWVPYALQAVSTIGQRSKIDAVLSTLPPTAAHMIGRRAKQLLRCSWIVDFRDVYNYLPPKQLMVKRIVRSADAIVTVSEPLAVRLRHTYGREQVWAIPNGFDPEELASRTDTLTSDFTITYTGSLYAGEEDRPARMGNVVRLLHALCDVIAEGKIPATNIRVRFYGRDEPLLPALVRQLRLEKIVRIHGPVPRHEALQRQRESQMLVMFGGGDAGFYSGKIFEYVAAGRPVLAIDDPHGVVAALLHETRAGVCPASQAELKTSLVGAYHEFRHSGRVIYEGEPEAIERYSHEQMAAKFAELLEEVTGRSSLTWRSAA